MGLAAAFGVTNVFVAAGLNVLIAGVIYWVGVRIARWWFDFSGGIGRWMGGPFAFVWGGRFTAPMHLAPILHLPLTLYGFVLMLNALSAGFMWGILDVVSTVGWIIFWINTAGTWLVGFGAGAFHRRRRLAIEQQARDLGTTPDALERFHALREQVAADHGIRPDQIGLTEQEAHAYGELNRLFASGELFEKEQPGGQAPTPVTATVPANTKNFPPQA